MNELHNVVATIMLNHAPLGYKEKWLEHRLCKTLDGHRVEGKQYWLEYSETPCSQTWVSDEKANEIMKDWKEQQRNGTLRVNKS